MSNNVLRMPGIRELPKAAPKSVRSVMDTLLITPAGIERWKRPPFQRELRVTKKVEALTATMKADGGVVPGIVTLGKLDGETYLVDGQHRVEAFRLSGLAEGYADVRICHFETMAEMAEEFVQLNSALVRLKTDDILRGLEGVEPTLAALRRRCPFVGYDNIRRNVVNSKLVAMSTAIRTWFGSVLIPQPGPSSIEAVRLLSDVEVDRLAKVLTICYEAWGRDAENFKLWGALNLAVVFWTWRRLVLVEGRGPNRGGNAIVTLAPEEFRQCLMALAANGQYVEWLVGRTLAERDRNPCYSRLKVIFAGRLGGMGFGRPILPVADWASH